VRAKAEPAYLEVHQMHRLRKETLALIAVACFACSTLVVNSDYDPQANFSMLRTYGWSPGGQVDVGDPRVDNALLESRVRSAVERELNAKGFALKVEGQPDFWVSYHAGIESKLDVTTLETNWPYSRGYSSWGGTYETQVREYEQGTLIIDIVNPRDETLMWRGTAQAEVHASATPEKRTKRANEVVARILANFPPQP